MRHISVVSREVSLVDVAHLNSPCAVARLSREAIITLADVFADELAMHTLDVWVTDHGFIGRGG
jgi:hypothetical protein